MGEFVTGILTSIIGAILLYLARFQLGFCLDFIFIDISRMCLENIYGHLSIIKEVVEMLILTRKYICILSK